METEFDAKSLIRTVRAGAHSHSRVAFQKATLLQLEKTQQFYCEMLRQELINECPSIAKDCKVKAEWGRSTLAFAKKWYISVSCDEF